MAYDEHTAERIRSVLSDKKIGFSDKNMMGGRIFFVDNKMLCGIHFDKKFGAQLLMARIGEDAYTKVIKNEVCLPMDFTGRPMRGYVFVTPDGIDLDADLDYWIQLCLDFNPMAKVSPRRKKKK